MLKKLLQEDLNQLVKWSNTWQMELNIDKCRINIAIKPSKRSVDYQMKGIILQVAEHHPYIWVEIAEHMKFNLHIDTMTSKASKVIGYLKRNIKDCLRKVTETAY